MPADFQTIRPAVGRVKDCANCGRPTRSQTGVNANLTLGQQYTGDSRERDGGRDRTILVVQCAWCGKVKMADGSFAFRPVEGSNLSHGICAECKEKMVQEIKQAKPLSA